MTFNFEALSYVYRGSGALANYRISKLSSDMKRNLEIFNQFDGSSRHREYKWEKEGLAIWFSQWFDLPAKLNQDLLEAIIAGWRPFERGKRLRDVPGALEDLKQVKAGLKKLSEDPEEKDGWLLQLNTLRYLPEAHILCSQDLKDGDAERVNDLLQQAERYFLDRMEDEK